MKKFLITLSLVTALCVNVNAQIQYNNYTQNTDGFFSTTSPSGNYRNGTADDGELFPSLPGMGYHIDQTAPLGSGLLVLAGLGLAYGLKRREK